RELARHAPCSPLFPDTPPFRSRAMLSALIAGERDPERLAALARGVLRKKARALIAALTGHFTAHHGFLLGQILAHIEELERHITDRKSTSLNSSHQIISHVVFC